MTTPQTDPLPTEATMLEALERTERYFAFLSDYMAAVANGSDAVNEEPMLVQRGIPVAVWIPEGEQYLIDRDAILAEIGLWVSGALSEEKIQALILKLDEGYDLDYTFIFLGVALADSDPDSADQTIAQFGSRNL
jgi:hypothetical protein